MTYPPPPASAAPQPGAQPRLRGRIPLRLAIIFLVLGIAGIVVGGIIAVNGALKKVDDFQRITVPQGGGVATKQVTFSGTGGYIVYYESKNADSKSIPAIPVALKPPSGSVRRLDTPYGGTSGGKNVKSLTYDYNGHKGVALWQFTITQKGRYTVAVGGSSNADPDAKIAIGRSIGKSTVIGAALIVVGVLLLITGIILLIIGLVKRSRSKKERDAALAGASYGGFGAPMYAQQPPAAGAPGYSAPPPPPPGSGYGNQPPPSQGYGNQPPQQQSPWPPQNDS